MPDWKKLQKVGIGNVEELCKECNSDLTDIANFIFDKEVHNEPTYRQELCKCLGCSTQFIMHYDIIDSGGHIYQRVFSEDINNDRYSWQEDLTEEQKGEISKHLESCEVCRERLTHEQLAEAWLKDFMQNLRQSYNKGK